MDIRNYFGVIGAKKQGKPAATNPKEAKRKNRISDSDDEDPLPPTNKKRVIVEDSDDDDILFVGKNSKQSKKEEKVKEEKHKKADLPKPSTPKLKPASAGDFFGSAPVNRKEDKTAKRKKSDDSKKGHESDDAFEKTLKQLDKEHHSAKKAKYASKSPKISPGKEEKPHPNENSPPNKLPKGGLASKLSAKVKESNENGGKEEEKEKEGKKEHEKERHHSHEKKEKHRSDKHEDKHRSERHEEKHKRESHSESKTKDIKKEKKSHDEKAETKSEERITPKKEPGSASELDTPKEKNKMAKCEEQITPKNEKITPKKEPGSTSELDTPKDQNKMPKKSEGSEDEIPGTPQMDDPDEKKKGARAAYFKFLQRSGPSNPGSKTIPEGEPQCLAGLVFVLSGVYESLDREEAAELVKKYGGKVTQSVSRNTSYMVVGSEAGQSKLKKAEQCGTKQLDEDGLLEMIRTRPGKGPKQEPKKEEAPSKLKAFAFEKEKKEPKLSKSPTSDELESQEDPISIKTPKLFTPSQKIPKFEDSPSSTTSSPKTQPLSSQDLSGKSGETLMWVDKYKPAHLKNIIGQQGDRSNMRKLMTWIQNWNKNQSGDKKAQRPSPWAKDDNGAFFKCALLSGPPGVGKTTTAHMVCREAGFDFVELNASDARSKRTLDQVVSELLSNKTLTNFAQSQGQSSTSAKHAMVMDEVDGMSGNEDRGGVQELISLIKKSRIPIIAMCNDRNHPKIRSLANHCFDLRFYKPRIEQIRGPMMSICFREGIKIKPDALDQIIQGSNQDIRQILHHLCMWSATEKNLQVDDMKREAQKAKKDLKMGPWDVCKKVFSEAEHKTMSIYDKSDLFFHDYSIASLFVQENYPKAVPHVAKGNRRATLEQLAKAADSLASGDLVERAIRSTNTWALLPTQAVFSSVLPGEYMSGHLAGQIEFPRWLGNNSKRNKFDRLMQELQMHMRLKISGSKLDVGMEYCGPLRAAVTNPLVKLGADGVPEAVKAMTTYDLLREDLEALQELSSWPHTKDPMAQVESKVKAAFTRLFNKESAPSPYTVQQVTKKKKGSKAGEDMYGEEEEEEEEEEGDDDVTADAMIKVKKGGGKGGDSNKGKGRGGSSSTSTSSRGKGSGSSSRGKGGGRGKGK